MSADEGNRPTVLVFHKLTSSVTYGVSNYSPRRFRHLIESMTDHGWRFDSLNLSSADQSRRGRGSLAVSFDDGYEHLTGVLPELIGNYRLQPLIFVPTDLEGRPNQWDYSHFVRPMRHLASNQIRRLSDIGAIFGSHGATHNDLTSCSDRELERELSDSRKRLQDWSGQSVDFVSYPFGRCNRRVRDAAEESGYRSGFTMKFPTPEDHPLARGRVPVYSFDTSMSVAAKLGGGIGGRIEMAKSSIVTCLSGGTVWLNRIRGGARRR